ncbi:MAG: hypothetical protein ACT4P2_03600 [Pseudomonadota bacterium]
MIGRILAWVLIALAAFVLGYDLVGFLASGKFAFAPLGQLWFSVSPGSLNLVQAVIERYIHPVLWDPIVFTVLLWPAWLVLVAPGVALALLFRRQSRRKRKWKSGAFE